MAVSGQLFIINSNSDKKLQKKNYLAFIGIILAVYLILIFQGINFPIYKEENFNTNLYGYFNSQLYSKNISLDHISYFANMDSYYAIPNHPPLTISLFYISSKLLGNHEYAYRLVPALFGFIGLFVIYLISKMILGRKAALISLLISATSFYYLLASLQIDPHGAVHFTLFSLCILFFLKYEQESEKNFFNKYLFISSFFAGLAILNVFSASLLFLIIFLYHFFRNNNLIKTIKFVIFFSIVPFFFVSISFILLYLYIPEILYRAFAYGSVVLNVNFNFKIFGYLFIWFGPLLICLSILSFKKERLLFILWCCIPIIFFSIQPSWLSIDKYLAMAIPSFIILASNTISEKIPKIDKRDFIIGAIITLFYLLLIFIMNMRIEYTANSIPLFLSKIFSFQWNFFLPITGVAGPYLGISFLSIAVTLIVSTILFTWYILFRKKAVSKIIFVSLASICFAFNAYLVSEYLFNLQHPDYMEAKMILIDYYKKNGENRIIISNDQSFAFYLNKTGYGLYEFYNRDIEEIKNVIMMKGAIVLIVDFPKIDKSSDYWRLVEKCELVKTTYSRGEITGYIFICNKQNIQRNSA